MNRSRNATEKVLSDYFESIAPAHDPQSAVELEKIRESVAETGTWSEHEEWRISTYFDNKIEREEINGRLWFKVSVACDMQEFSCQCPTLEKAYMYAKLYQHLIIYQYYSVGPPWA